MSFSRDRRARLLDRLDARVLGFAGRLWNYESFSASSHTAYRFGHHTYNLDASTVERIAMRDGVIGLIFSEHFVADGLRATRTRSFDESFSLLCMHIDRIYEITGSYRHVALGSDLDGFIKADPGGV